MQRLPALFLILFAALTALLSSHCVSAQNPSLEKDLVADIDGVRDASADLDTLTVNITIITVIKAAPICITDFGKIIQSLGNFTTTLKNGISQPLTDLEAGRVVAALDDFVKVHQQLLATVIGKHGILSQFGFAEPVRVVLGELEAAIDAFLLALIAAIPTRASDCTQAKATLDVAVKSCITTYS